MGSRSQGASTRTPTPCVAEHTGSREHVSQGKGAWLFSIGGAPVISLAAVRHDTPLETAGAASS